jgi:hypothetical protein
VLLAILIHFSRRCVFFNELGILEALAQFDIRQTVPRLQHEFCTLWNELVQEARSRGRYTIPFGILREIRHLFLTLHQGTDAAPTAFSASTEDFDDVLLKPSSYPLCDIASHPPDSTTVPLLTQPGDPPDTPPHHSTSNGSTVLRQEATIIAGPPSSPDLTISRDPAASPALPAQTTDASSPGAVAAALEDIPSASTLSYPLEGTAQQDIVASCAEPDISETLSVASTPAPTSGAASNSDPLRPASPGIGFSTPASPPSRVPPLPDAGSHALLNGTTSSRSTISATIPRLRARGLVNTGGIPLRFGACSGNWAI